MAPSLLSLGTAALACAGGVVANKWHIEESYDATNFFDKFNFIESKFGTGDSNDIDPSGGFVNYRNKKDAVDLGLIATQGDVVYMGVDHRTVLDGAGSPGRSSVRLESKTHYNHGLFIARFTHLPVNKCGVWPALWTYGNDWPNDGEVDIYENWNNAVFNQPALHSGSSSTFGECLLDGVGQTSLVTTENCDNTFQDPPNQYENQGCAAQDRLGPWADPTGGIYAMEWTKKFIKLYAFTNANAPTNIGSDTPNTASWGEPSIWLKNPDCDIDNHFANQRLVLNIDFCGAPAGFDSVWRESCAAVTKQDTCVDYVSKSPDDFADAYFLIEDIRYFTSTSTSPTSTASASESTTAAPATTTTSSEDATTTGTETVSASMSTGSDDATTTGTETASASASTSDDCDDEPTVTGTETAPAATSTSDDCDDEPTATETGTAPASTSTEVDGTTTTADVSTTSPIATMAPTTTWSNSTMSTSSVEMTTSVVYTTEVHTVTKCPSWVTNCPAGGHVTTVLVPLYTTICPVEATETASPSATSTMPSGGSQETITTEVTTVYTITSCPPAVTNCPVGSVTTEVLTTTYCPGEATSVPTGPAPGPRPAESSSNAGVTAPMTVQPSQTTVIYETQTVVPQQTSNGGENNSGSSGSTGVSTMAKPSATACVGPSCPGSSGSGSEGSGSEGCNGADCPPPVVGSSSQLSVSGLVVLIAAAAMML